MTIDWWTLGLQSVNVLILVWLLGRFFWQPVAALIAKRRAATEQALADVEARRAEASAALAGIEQTRAGFAGERDALLAAARQVVEQEHAARLSQAATEAATLVAAAQTQIEADKTAAEKAWADRAGQLAVEIATRLVGRLKGSVLRAAFLDCLVREVGDLPAAERQALATEGAALDAVSAEALDPAEQERCRAAISVALQTQPRIDFAVDPALIAGLELRNRHLTVSNSWHADLDRILAELTHDDRR